MRAFRTTAGARRPCFTHEMLLLSLARKTDRLSAHIALWVDEEIERAISRGAEEDELVCAAGGPSLRDDARAKILAGITSPEEAWRAC